jgi:hypothetical protein
MVGQRRPLVWPSPPGHKAAQVGQHITVRRPERHMPTLFRFLMVIGVLAGATFGGLYVLAEHMEPESKETVTSVPGVKVRR